jgi:type I restriction enzyme S subunit
MTFPAYSAYKNSGVEWLGAVPDDWSVNPLKRAISKIESGTSVNAADVPAEAGCFGVLKTSCVYQGSFDWRENKTVVDEELYRVSCPLTKNTLVVSRMNTPDLVGATGLVEEAPDGIYLPDRLWQVYFEPNQTPKFMYYFTKSPAYREQVKIACCGSSSSMQNLGQDEFRSLWFAEPSPFEQTQIASFLDHETARIDVLIAEQRRLIELLKEKRQAVISHAVTKGLDPTVPMKDSGVEWLGEVPAHWVKKRLKNISPFVTVGIVVNPSDYVADEGLPFLYGGEVKEGFIEVDKARKISLEDSRKNRKTMLETGDIVTMRVGYPGLTAVVPPECAGGNCASVMLVKRGNFNSKWLCAVMNSRLVRQQVEVVQYGAAQKQFNIADAIEFWMYKPPLSEQSEIAEFIDAQSLVFNTLKNESEQLMSLLKERRAALISAAVTGKIDVRSWHPPANAQNPELEQEAVYG